MVSKRIIKKKNNNTFFFFFFGFVDLVWRNEGMGGREMGSSKWIYTLIVDVLYRRRLCSKDGVPYFYRKERRKKIFFFSFLENGFLLGKRERERKRRVLNLAMRSESSRGFNRFGKRKTLVRLLFPVALQKNRRASFGFLFRWRRAREGNDPTVCHQRGKPPLSYI